MRLPAYSPGDMINQKGMTTDRIEINPAVMMGKPVVRGTRITVELILRKLADGATENELLEDYAHLTTEDIRAAVAYGGASVAHEEVVLLPTPPVPGKSYVSAAGFFPLLPLSPPLPFFTPSLPRLAPRLHDAACARRSLCPPTRPAQSHSARTPSNTSRAPA